MNATDGSGGRHPATRVPSNYVGLHGVSLEVIRSTNMSVLYGKHRGVYAPVGVHECVFDLELERKSLMEFGGEVRYGRTMG